MCTQTLSVARPVTAVSRPVEMWLYILYYFLSVSPLTVHSPLLPIPCRVRRHLFDLFAQWIDEDSIVPYGGGASGGITEWRAEVERAKGVAVSRTRDLAERQAVEREVMQQADAVHVSEGPWLRNLQSL